MSDLEKSVKAILFFGSATMLLSLAAGLIIQVFENRNVWHMMLSLALLFDVYFWSLFYLGPRKFDIEISVSDDIKRFFQNTLIVFTVLMGIFAFTNGF